MWQHGECLLRKKLADTTAKLQQTEAELVKQTTLQEPGTPISRDREQLFHSIVVAKLKSGDHTITTQGLRGRPITLMKVPSSEKSSEGVSHRTLQRRSQVLEKATQIVSGAERSLAPEQNQSLVAQQADLIRRNSAHFLQAAQKAGMKIFAKFKLEPMAALSAEMPLSTIAVLKRLFIKTFGNDPFTTLAAIREARAELSFNYEGGSFDDQDSNKVHFLRITDTDTVLQKTVINLSNSGELKHLRCYAQDELRLLVTLDKGGCSTKLVLQVLNAKRRHSTSTARLLGFFRGGEDSSSNVAKVFGPIIASLYNTAKNVHKLQLPAPAAPTQQFSPTAQLAKQISVMKHLQSLGITASGTGRISAECKHCNRVATDQRASQPSASHVTQCKIVAGGDWLFEAALLGLTGPKGRHCCNFCLAKQSSLVKGKPHSPVLLPRYMPHKPEADTFAQRTFEDLEKDHMAFVAAGGNKSKAADFNNSINPTLLPAYGAVICSLSCTPLHVFLGLADQALKLVEGQAGQLDETVKAHQGFASPQIKQLLAEKDEASEALISAMAEAESAACAAEEAEAAVQSFQTQHAELLQQHTNHFSCSTQEQKRAQRQLAQLQQTLKNPNWKKNMLKRCNQQQQQL